MLKATGVLGPDARGSMNSETPGHEIVARHGDAPEEPQSEQALADADQTAANADQQISGADQRSSDTDQQLAGLDQAASDHEQEAADRLHEAVVDPTPAEIKDYQGTKDARATVSAARQRGRIERSRTGRDRDAAADQRDRTAGARDERGLERDERDRG